MTTFRSFAVSSALLLSLVVGGSACSGGGQYGHSPNYAPLSAEESALAGAREYDPVMYQRFPDDWRKSPVSLFGVVTGRAPGAGGSAYLTLSVRRLEPRNLCENANDDDSCRVTVSDRDFGIVHGLIALRPEDDVGTQSLAAGSLVRIVGRLGQDTDPGDGGPIVRASYYRHWPRYTYVTKAAAREMRQ